MPVQRIIEAGGVPVKVFTEDIDENCVQQLAKVSRLPIMVGHMAAMPDVHLGKGATIGSVLATSKALIPAAVGVDIGCGMTAAKLTIGAEQLPDNLRTVREAIENAVPVGRANHERAAVSSAVIDTLRPGIEETLAAHPAINKMMRNPAEKFVIQVGTLGGGNHFIEICADTDDNVWLMLHSGSRGIGNVIGRYFTSLAKDEMRRADRQMPEDKDLCYLKEGNPGFADYVHALHWAQAYALENRRAIFRLTLDAIRPLLPRFRVADQVVECHHNYVAVERHFGQEVYVTRKGAVRAQQGDRGIIPGSMGTRSYIVRGLGCETALNSCAHGAGRRMSRSEAKRRFTAADLASQTSGVECRKDDGVVDEAPGAYKDIDQVIADASDLVEVEATLKQVVCVKG